MSFFTETWSVITARVVTFVLLLFLLVSATLLFALSVEAAPKAKLIEFWDDSEPASRMQVNHDSWQEILTAYVDDQHPSGINRVNYSEITAADALKLKNYLKYLETHEPRQLNSEEAKAYWINLYNAMLVDKIVDAYQSGSNRAVRRLLRGSLRTSSWDRDAAEVVFQSISLKP